MQISVDPKRKPGRRLAKSMASTFGLRVTYTGLTFVINVLLARLLGVSGFGMYVYAFTWVSLLSIITTVGLENLMVREVALYKSRESWGLLQGLLRRADQIVFCVSSCVGLIAVAIAWHTWQSTDWPMFLVFSAAMVGLPPASLRNLRRGAMDGLSRVALGFLSETIIDPLLFILLTVAAALLANITAPFVMTLYSGITFITFAISAKILKNTLPKFKDDSVPEYRIRAWLKSAVPFMFLGSLYVISTRVDILMLGALKGVEVAGLYMPINRGAQLLTFIPAAVGRVLAPQVAQTYAAGNIDQLRKIITKSSRMIFVISCPIVVIFIGASYWYLLLFGPEFINGKNALNILCIGQLAITLAGLPSILLNMTGYESHTALVAGIGVGLNTAFNAVLIPLWSLEGAAIATATSLMLVALANAWIVQQKLNINPTVFTVYRHGEN